MERDRDEKDKGRLRGEEAPGSGREPESDTKARVEVTFSEGLPGGLG